MRPHVSVEIGVLRVPFAADIAHETTFRHVHYHVLLQVGGTGKMLLANVTETARSNIGIRARTEISVDFHMLMEIEKTRIVPHTDVALIAPGEGRIETGLLSTVCDHVPISGTPQHETSVANLTDKLLPTVIVRDTAHSHMCI